MPRGAESDRVGGLFRRVGVGADLQARDLASTNPSACANILVGRGSRFGSSDFSTSTWTISEAAVLSSPG